ncbi:MAG: phosphoribosylanthranilate isomerase [Desulfobacterales bacterium]|jgi:phosphoribosylanthranilate isomerase
MNALSPTPGGLQVKICGLTRPQEALACAMLGVDAIGLIFYRKSPRFISIPEARTIAAALPHRARLVGVFVNHDYDAIMRHAEGCGLWGAQLHGQESPDLVNRLRDAGLTVIKALFRNGKPSLAEAAAYDPAAFLIESGVGPLPGGNAKAWDWSDARAIARQTPVVLAGGLSDLNVLRAAESARADAVDVSSGVEDRPGRKNMDRVVAFLETVSRFVPSYIPKTVF